MASTPIHRTSRHSAVLNWLQTIDVPPAPVGVVGDVAAAGPGPQLFNPRKRPRNSHGSHGSRGSRGFTDCNHNFAKRQALSPPITDTNTSRKHRQHSPRAAMGSVGRGVNEVEEDAADMVTPRPLQRHQQWPPSVQGRPSPNLTASTRSSSKRSGSSSISRQSSPTKQLRSAGLDDDGYTRRKFPLDTRKLPQTLQTLITDLRGLDHGHVRLPREWWDEAMDTLDIPEAFFQPFEPDHSISSPPLQPDVPLLSFIARIIQSATECDEMNEPECVWSDEVYRPILSWVLRPNNNKSGLVDFRCSTSSKITRLFSPSASTSKMVDFCFVFKPQMGGHLARHIDAICRTRPDKSINHTDAGALCSYPIGLSLEFKSPGADVTMAMVQIGTWHAAQWRSLCFECPESSPRAIEFLPGIIVQGHEWYFVATVPPQSPTIEDISPLPFNHTPTLYSRILLGSTEHPTGVCKIIAALRCLVTWLEERYWPAFQQQVLRREYTAPPS